MKRSHSPLHSVSLPIFITVIVTGFFGILLTNLILSPKTSAYFRTRHAYDLQLATLMSLEICETRFEELLAMRLSDNHDMVTTMRRDATNRIRDIASYFPDIDIIILENQQETVLNTEQSPHDINLPADLPVKMPAELPIYELSDGCLIHWRYFPYWRWHIIAFLTNTEATAVPKMVLYGTLFFEAMLLLIFLTSLYVVFTLRVRKPLAVLREVAGNISREEFPKTGIKRNDEIGSVAAAMDDLIDWLADTIRDLETSVKDKEILLQEVHHRVRNNLNLVISLLDLQAARIENVEDATLAFEESTTRIHTMAIIHGQLYETGEYGRVNIRDFIESLSARTSQIYAGKIRVDIECRIEEHDLSLNTAIPLGLFINEALTNAYKHAFAGRESGRVTVIFENRDSLFRLKVRDNGIGLAPAMDPHNPGDSLGFTLMLELSDQLNGQLSVSSEEGLELVLEFLHTC